MSRITKKILMLVALLAVLPGPVLQAPPPRGNPPGSGWSDDEWNRNLEALLGVLIVDTIYVLFFYGDDADTYNPRIEEVSEDGLAKLRKSFSNAEEALKKAKISLSEMRQMYEEHQKRTQQ